MRIKNNWGVGICFLSIIIALMVITWFYFRYGSTGLTGAGWILTILGFPTSFLNFAVYKLGSVFGIYLAPPWDLVRILFFYFLQYAIIASLIHHFRNSSKNKMLSIKLVLVSWSFLVFGSITLLIQSISPSINPFVEWASIFTGILAIVGLLGIFCFVIRAIEKERIDS